MGNFDNKVGSIIAQTAAEVMISDYQFVNTGCRRSLTLGKDVIDQLLGQQGAQGLKFFYAQDAQGERELVVYAYDTDGNPLNNLPAGAMLPCPPFCGDWADDKIDRPNPNGPTPPPTRP